jgi:ketosteroid isomerase-like protein
MTPTEALKAICEAWNRLDHDALADLFTEDGVFEDPLNERTARGREDVRAITGPGMAALSECEVTLSTVVENGELALCEGMFRSALAEGGARFDFPFAMAVELRDGRIARLSEYFDTAPLV